MWVLLDKSVLVPPKNISWIESWVFANDAFIYEYYY